MNSGDRSRNTHRSGGAANNRTAAITKSSSLSKNSAASFGGKAMKKDISPKSGSGSSNGAKKNNKSLNSRQFKRNTIIRNEISDLSCDVNLGSGKNWQGNMGGKGSKNKFNNNKKVNINHLINATYEDDTGVFTGRVNSKPYHKDFGRSAAAPSHNYVRPTTVNYTKQHYNHYTKLSKINHVRTHCQTLLRKSSVSVPTVKELNADVNMYIEWDDTIAGLQFYQDRLDRNLCAICLSDQPICPRATRCGHIFCFSCILHHFSVYNPELLSKERQKISWHKCPICHKEILKKKLKPARIVLTDDRAEVGKSVTFDLVTRAKGSNFGAVDYGNDLDLENNYGEDSVNFCESIFSWIDLETEKKLLLEDLESLKFGLEFAEKSEVPFYKEAIEITNNDIKNLEGREESEEKLHFLDKVSEKKVGDEEYLQYYQNKNRRMFLHPITKRLITEQFLGAPNESSDPDSQAAILKKLPRAISGKVVEIDNIQVSDDIVKRFKFLNHLPLGTTIQLVELNFTSIKAIEYLPLEEEKGPESAATDAVNSQEHQQITGPSQAPTNAQTTTKAVPPRSRYTSTCSNVSTCSRKFTRVMFDKEVLNRMRPAMNKRKQARSKKAKNEKNYQNNIAETPLEDLYLYSEHDFPTGQGTGGSTAQGTNFHEPVDFEDMDGYQELQESIKDSEEPKESFGLAAKIACPFSKNRANVERSFGLASMMRTAETDEEKAARILAQPEKSHPKLSAKNLPVLDQNEELQGSCYLTIKSKNNKNKNRKRGKKQGPKDKN